jgi:DNA-binding IclR family transcriptional regulator
MSAEKTLDILDLFTETKRELTVPEIAELLDQPVSSVYRHLKNLKDREYVFETSKGSYRLGYRFLYMANIVRLDNKLSEIALPVMKKLTLDSEETTLLTIVSGLSAVCLETVHSIQPIKVSSDQGKIVPLHVGASSKALLAHLPGEIVGELYNQKLIKRYTPNTITDREALECNLEEIREQGYAFSDEEIDEGVMTYGVPIRNANRDVVAALSVAGLRPRMLKKDKQRMIELIHSAVKEIEKYI